MSNYFKMIAEYEKFSECKKRKIAAIGVADGYIKTGYNQHYRACDCTGVKGEHSKTVIHAELFAIDKNTHTLYVSYQPCIDCAKAIIKRSGIKTIYYRDAKPEDIRGIELLQSSGVKCLNVWS